MPASASDFTAASVIPARPAHVRLAAVQPGHRRLQVVGVERVKTQFLAGTDQVVQRGVPVGGDRVEFPAEHHVARMAGPVEQRDPVAGMRLGSEANIARIGVMPTPPAISSTRRPVTAGVNAPYGPSAMIRVPLVRLAREPLWSPRALTVMRIRLGCGMADRE